jgi:Xaa-Pro aminopeptidase
MSDWPAPTPTSALARRRDALRARLRAPALIASGFARPRNFLGNPYEFRASSHFLYLVGRQIEGAALLLESDAATLFVEPPAPDDVLWTGSPAALDQLERELELRVRPIEELARELWRAGETATLPPPDLETSEWLRSLLERPVEPDPDDSLSELDAALSDAMIEQRLVHDEAAIAQLRQAAALTIAAHRAGMNRTRPGLREAVVMAEMERSIRSAGGRLAYGPIVTVRGEVLHNDRHDGMLNDGDLLLCDVGAETPEGWAGDVTRTWPVSGRFSASQRDAYQAVLAAHDAAVAAVRPGTRFRDVHRIAARTLLEGLVGLGVFRGDVDELYERGAAGVFFPHGVGHLLGLDVHDLEDLGDRAGYPPGRSRATSLGEKYLRLDRDLAPGMAVTIEPGFYRISALLDDPSESERLGDALDRSALARFSDVRGIRIEDDVLVTETGNEVITGELEKEPSAVEARIARTD